MRKKPKNVNVKKKKLKHT